MKKLLLALLVCLAALRAQPAAGPSLHGAVTDPSGAAVPGAMVLARGPGGQQRATTNITGQYTLGPLAPGKYSVRVIAKGFTVAQRADVAVDQPTALDVQLSIEAETQVVNVEEEISRVNTDPAQNGSALVLKEKELEALSDDPDELSQQLQAMAGPAAGPNGGQIYIDGFTGGNLPPKSAIREVRINSNPYAPEYDRPGFGRIEIFTRPGTDNIRGQIFIIYNKEFLNARSPLLAQSTRPPFQSKMLGFNVSGPVKKQKASFSLDFERRDINENAFVLATTLDANLNPLTVNQGIVTPQTRTTITPRFDYSINPNNNLTVRYQNVEIGLDKQGVGDYNLSSRAYNQNETENTVQMTENSVINTRMVNETRFQFMRAATTQTGNGTIPGTNVQDAFYGGGATIGNSGNTVNGWELTNNTTFTRGTHTIKWGGRVRQSFLSDTSVSNFAGTYTFFGGLGPALDPNDLLGSEPNCSAIPAPANCVALTALERYQRTLQLQQLNIPAAQILLLGGGPSQLSQNAGIPTATVTQMDLGIYVNDDWRVRQNLTFSYGARYEAQTNYGDLSDFSPRLGIAWGMDGKANKPAKTVLRAGFGVFYDRLANSVRLAEERYNGTAQQSYLIQDPVALEQYFGTNPVTGGNYVPFVPSPAQLSGALQPQQIQLVAKAIRAPRNFQANVGVDRQINKYARISVNYINSRGVHLQRTRNINTPIDGGYPFGDSGIRLLTESTGFSRTNQMIVSPNVNYKKIFLFGFYSLSFGKDDNEGQPANPYNLSAEWGPSSFADVRHRFVTGSSLPLPMKFSISPFILVSSGTPYDITIGRPDANGDGFTVQRPAIVGGLGPSACQSPDLVWEPAFGCFNLAPTAGTPTIGRNSARGPGQVTMNFRLARTWGFGNRGESGPSDQGGGPPPGAGGARGEGPRGGGGGGMRGGGGPPPGMFGPNTGKKYNLMLSISARNALNHPNYAAPSGDLSSPYFGEYRSLAGFGPFAATSTYNRRIDLQLRFTF